MPSRDYKAFSKEFAKRFHPIADAIGFSRVSDIYWTRVCGEFTHQLHVQLSKPGGDVFYVNAAIYYSRLGEIRSVVGGEPGAQLVARDRLRSDGPDGVEYDWYACETLEALTKSVEKVGLDLTVFETWFKEMSSLSGLIKHYRYLAEYWEVGMRTYGSQLDAALLYYIDGDMENALHYLSEAKNIISEYLGAYRQRTKERKGGQKVDEIPNQVLVDERLIEHYLSKVSE